MKKSPTLTTSVAKNVVKERFSYKLGKTSKSKGYRKDPEDKILNKLLANVKRNPKKILAKLDVKLYVVERYIDTLEEVTDFKGCEGIKKNLKEISRSFNELKELRKSNPEKLDSILTKFMQKLNSLVRKESLHMRLRDLNYDFSEALELVK